MEDRFKADNGLIGMTLADADKLLKVIEDTLKLFYHGNLLDLESKAFKDLFFIEDKDRKNKEKKINVHVNLEKLGEANVEIQKLVSSGSLDLEEGQDLLDLTFGYAAAAYSKKPIYVSYSTKANIRSEDFTRSFNALLDGYDRARDGSPEKIALAQEIAIMRDIHRVGVDDLRDTPNRRVIGDGTSQEILNADGEVIASSVLILANPNSNPELHDGDLEVTTAHEILGHSIARNFGIGSLNAYGVAAEKAAVAAEQAADAADQAANAATDENVERLRNEANRLRNKANRLRGYANTLRRSTTVILGHNTLEISDEDKKKDYLFYANALESVKFEDIVRRSKDRALCRREPDTEGQFLYGRRVPYGDTEPHFDGSEESLNAHINMFIDDRKPFLTQDGYWNLQRKSVNSPFIDQEMPEIIPLETGTQGKPTGTAESETPSFWDTTFNNDFWQKIDEPILHLAKLNAAFAPQTSNKNPSAMTSTNKNNTPSDSGTGGIDDIKIVYNYQEADPDDPVLTNRIRRGIVKAFWDANNTV